MSVRLKSALTAAGAAVLISLGAVSVQAAPVTDGSLSFQTDAIDISAQRRDYGCGVGPAGPIPPGGYWHRGQFYGCQRGGGGGGWDRDRRGYGGRDYDDRPRRRGGGCGMGPAGPIPPGGYWHQGRFYGC